MSHIQNQRAHAEWLRACAKALWQGDAHAQDAAYDHEVEAGRIDDMLDRQEKQQAEVQQ